MVRPLRPWTDPRALLLGIALVGLVAAAGGRWLVTRAIAAELHDRAAGRGLTASWSALRLAFPLDVTVRRLRFVSATDTVFAAESLHVDVNPWSVLLLRPHVRSLALAHATARLRSAAAADPDTLIPESPPDPYRTERAQNLRRGARRLVELLLEPARELPNLSLRDVTVQTPGGENGRFGGIRISWLELRAGRAGARLDSRGQLLLERPIPFEVGVDYGRDDRLRGGARLLVPATGEGPPEPFRLALDGRLEQDRGAGALRLADSTRVILGEIPLGLSGTLERDGPRVRFALAADGITQPTVARSFPGAALGRLADLSVRGSFDYRVRLDLDFARPDSVRLFADVVPHGLALAPATRREGFDLEPPFTAVIHLPRGARAARELSPANPRFRPLEAIDSMLVHAVVTNEDGGFHRHRGFNLEAVRGAIAENLKAGAYRRGAGTITMQLARNLYLGHERTLSRKAQEVVLAWILEHLTGVSKRRLLEIYLNIIEWGPGVHGADEAAHWYFGHDAGRLTVDEALFLSTVVPAPRKWRYRFDARGELRGFARAQMHFIGRAMIGKGWLARAALPPADSLRVEIRGPARDVLFPPADSAAVHLSPGEPI